MRAGRHLPQRQAGHRRGRLAQHPRVADPKAPLSAGGQLSQIIDFESSKVVDDDHAADRPQHAVRDPRLAAGRVHARHHPRRRVRPGQPGRHRRVRLQVVRGRQDQHLHQVRRLLGRRGLPRRAGDPGLHRRQRQGQRAAGAADPDRRQPALQPDRHDQGCGRRRARAPTAAQWVPFTMRVDQAPFDDVRVRQAMRLIVDRQAMIDQTLSGYGSLGNDMYAPLDVNYASDLPQREQDIDQAKSLLAAAGAGGAAGRALHRRRHRLGGRPGREPLRRAGQGGRRRGQGHQEDAVLRRRLPVLHVRPGLLEHPQLHPAGRRGHVPARPGWHLQRDPLGQRGPPRPRQRRGQGGRRGQARATCSSRRRRSSTTRAA